MCYWIGIAALAFAACSSGTKTVWTKPDVTEAEWRRDKYECIRESRTFAGGTGIAGFIAMQQAEDEARKLFRLCMESRGWERREVPADHPAWR